MIWLKKLPIIFACLAICFFAFACVLLWTFRESRDEVEIIQISGNDVQNVISEQGILGDENFRLSINDASEEELDTIPGVGPATILKIIDGRPWKDLDSVLKLIGARYREKAKERIRL